MTFKDSERKKMSEELINKINEILENKKDAVINIVNDRLTISVFTLL